MAGNSDLDFDAKNDQFLPTAQVSQKRAAFEKFVTTTYKDNKELIRHFDKVKSSLSSKIEQVFAPETMLEYFDRISQRPFSRIANTNKTRWTDDEVLLLTHLMIYYSFANSTDFETLPEEAWGYLASIFPNKEPSQLKKRWQGCLKKTLWQVPWTQPEDELLEQILNEKGHTRKWKEIAEELNARSEMEVYRHGRQCRERWNNHLDPSIARGPFTEEEDLRLFQIYREIGKKWAEISKKMKNRTENAVKNRFNSLIKKLKSRQNTLLSENLSIMSTESDGDNSKLEKKLVDHYLHQYEIGGVGKLGLGDGVMGNLKNELHDQSEPIFESDSDSGPKKGKNKGHSGGNQKRPPHLEANRRPVRSLGELSDIKSFLSNSLAMDEEYPRTRTNASTKGMGYENLIPNQFDKFDLFQNSHPFCQSPSSHRFAQGNPMNKQNSMMLLDSPTRGRSSSLHTFPNHLQGGNANKFLPTSLFDSLNSQALFQGPEGKFQPEAGYKIGSNPLLGRTSHDLAKKFHPNNQSHEPNLLELDENNLHSPMAQHRFHFDNFDNRMPRNLHPKLEDDFHEFSPTKKLVGMNQPFKAKKLDKHRTQNQIGQSNLQYAIVDLTKNEVYMVHPVTKDNYNGTLSKMGDDTNPATTSIDNLSRLKNSELLMLGKGGDHSPSLNYLQSLINKSSFTSDHGTSNTNLPSFLDTSDMVDKSKSNSVNPVERRFQDIRQKFENIDNHDLGLKGKGKAEASLH